MSSQDNLERTLKEIHLLFAKSEPCGEEPGKVIVDRKRFMELLDELNRAVFAVMEAYEDTQESRTKAELEFQQKGRKMMEEASQRADDVYAASVLYTADAVGELQKLMDQMNDSMNEMFHSFRMSLREQKDILRRNELELESELKDLEDTRLYQEMLEDIRLKQRRLREEEHLERREAAALRRQSGGRISIPASSADVKVNEAYFEKQGISAADAQAGYVPAPAPPAAEKPEVIVNYNSEYFKRKAALEKERQEAAADAPDASEMPDIPRGGQSRSAAGGDEKEPDSEALLRFLQNIESEPFLEEGAAGPENPGASGTDDDSDPGGINRREVPGWKERMKQLLNEIAPKDLDEK